MSPRLFTLKAEGIGSGDTLLSQNEKGIRVPNAIRDPEVHFCPFSREHPQDRVMHLVSYPTLARSFHYGSSLKMLKIFFINLVDYCWKPKLSVIANRTDEKQMKRILNEEIWEHSKADSQQCSEQNLCLWNWLVFKILKFKDIRVSISTVFLVCSKITLWNWSPTLAVQKEGL